MTMRVTIYEVGPRDGLQSLPHVVPVEQRRQLISSLYNAGLQHVEEVSFVHPKLLPQMANAEDVYSGKGDALVLNKRGHERAVAAGVERINIVLSPCESFCINNMGRRYDELVLNYRTFMQDVPKDKVRVYLSMAFGSPDSGVFDARTLRRCISDAKMFGDTIVFADTVGVGTANDVWEMSRLAQDYGMRPALHLHHRGDEGKPLTLVRAGILAGISEFDASIGGLGGCPFARGGGANIATESLARHLHAWGLETGLDSRALRSAAALAFTMKHPQPQITEAHC